MTKEQYFEMCEMLGSTPIDSQIPFEFEDLPVEVQEALYIYNNLQDNWDYMGGNYIGKNFTGIKDILEISGVEKENYKSMYELLIHIDAIRSKQIQNSKPKST